MEMVRRNKRMDPLIIWWFGHLYLATFLCSLAVLWQKRMLSKIINFKIFNVTVSHRITVSMSMDQLAWTNQEALHYGGILMAARAGFALIVLFNIPILCKKFDETLLLIWVGYFGSTVSRLLYLPFGSQMPKMAIPNNRDFYWVNDIPLTEYTQITNDTMADMVGCPMSQKWCLTTPAVKLTQLILAVGVAGIAQPFGVSLSVALLTKVLGSRPLGKWVSYITAAGCLGRLIGPFSVGYFYSIYGIYPLFGTLSACTFVTFVWFLFIT